MTTAGLPCPHCQGSVLPSPVIEQLTCVTAMVCVQCGREPFTHRPLPKPEGRPPGRDYSDSRFRSRSHGSGLPRVRPSSPASGRPRGRPRKE